MPQSKPLPTPIQRGIPAKSGTVNFFFQQDSNQLKRKWGQTDDFWSATRPSVSNAAPNWREFENWQTVKKTKS